MGQTGTNEHKCLDHKTVELQSNDAMNLYQSLHDTRGVITKCSHSLIDKSNISIITLWPEIIEILSNRTDSSVHNVSMMSKAS